MTRLIDADALKLSHCNECALYPDKCMGDDCDWGAIIHINEMPTIDAEPVRHGKWVIEDGHVCCSECGEISKEFNYCPYCGSRMDKERDSDHAEEEIL